MRTTLLPAGEAVPVLGLGTWHMAEDTQLRADEVEALRLGLDLGMTLIDTAEMYADGGAEEVVGEAIRGRRDDVFLVSKVLPQHATRKGVLGACEASLRRLGTDHLDLYLLHWRGSPPLAQTLDGFHELQHKGLIRHWGVSNFDDDDMQELLDLDGGREVQCNQVLYNLMRRGIEFDLLPRCQKVLQVPIMAYSPIEQGRILRHPAVRQVAEAHNATPAQVALAWVLRDHGVIAIPKSASPQHVRENQAALEITLTVADEQVLDAAFPPPARPVPLEML
jgi:diketogulonate reductase-like aldo/keto reductase